MNAAQPPVEETEVIKCQSSVRFHQDTLAVLMAMSQTCQSAEVVLELHDGAWRHLKVYGKNGQQEKGSPCV